MIPPVSIKNCICSCRSFTRYCTCPPEKNFPITRYEPSIRPSLLHGWLHHPFTTQFRTTTTTVQPPMTIQELSPHKNFSQDLLWNVITFRQVSCTMQNFNICPADIYSGTALSLIIFAETKNHISVQWPRFFLEADGFFAILAHLMPDLVIPTQRKHSPAMNDLTEQEYILRESAQNGSSPWPKSLRLSLPSPPAPPLPQPSSPQTPSPQLNHSQENTLPETTLRISTTREGHPTTTGKAYSILSGRSFRRYALEKIPSLPDQRNQNKLTSLDMNGFPRTDREYEPADAMTALTDHLKIMRKGQLLQKQVSNCAPNRIRGSQHRGMAPSFFFFFNSKWR